MILGVGNYHASELLGVNGRDVNENTDFPNRPQSDADKSETVQVRYPSKQRPRTLPEG